MTPTTKITTTLFAALIAAGCSATDAPTVEFTNSANKNDAVDLTFALDDGESIDIGLDCEQKDGCDIVILVADESFGALQGGGVDVTLTRPDGFSRTDNLWDDAAQGQAATGFFNQTAGYHTVTVTNNIGEDRRLLISARWVGARPGASEPVGAACFGPEDCAEGQACVGPGGGQAGFCTTSCDDLGQMRCDQTGSVCVGSDAAGTDASYCFSVCDAMTDCGGDHLECIQDAVTDEAGNSFGLCAISAEVEMPEGMPAE